jgi:tyrosine-protein kinase Etk/Wzc
LAIDRKASIEKAQEALIAWRKANDIWDLGQLTQAHSAQIGALEQEKEELKRQLAVIDAELSLLDSRQRRGLAPADSTADERRSLEILLARQTELQVQLERAQRIYNENSTAVRRLREELGEINASVTVEASSLHRFKRATTLSKRGRLSAQISELDRKLRELKQDKGLAKAQVTLKKLEYELSVSERNYAEILEKIDQAKVVEQAKRNEANFTIIERPAPGAKFGGTSGGGLNHKKIGGVVLFGLLIAVSGTLLFGTLSATFSLRKQVEMLGLPILGIIPKVGKSFRHDAFVNHPNSSLAAQVRKLIVNIVRKDENVRRILVTSCWPSEGKSFVSANLAAALTKFQLKVTLVDADLRKPFLTSFFEQKGNMGLRQGLQGECPVEELTQPTSVENLNFLPAGTGAEDPTELFHREFELNSLSDREDKFLVVDTAPLSVCSDAIQLSDQVDGVIVVVSAKYWTGKAELEYVLDLEEQGVKILGVILNGVRDSELTYFHYYKKVYGSYQTDTPKSRV